MNCKMLADSCPCFNRAPTKLCLDLVSFVCWIVPELWAFARKSMPDLVVHALNCAHFFVVCALNCARILVVRALDCAQFLLYNERTEVGSGPAATKFCKDKSTR